MGLIPIEDKSISLNETSLIKLLEELKSHYAVTEKGDGEYIILKIGEGITDNQNHAPSQIAEALTSALSQKDILSSITPSSISDEIGSVFKGAIKIKEMEKAVSNLRFLLDSGDTKESTYQRWCENHSWAFGNSYILDEEDIRTISPHDQLDILLSNVIAGFRDVIELKRPDLDILRYDDAHRNFYFSSEVSKAIGQCHRYLDILQESALRGLRDHPEIVAYHPRAIIVIGRSMDWTEEMHRGLHGLNARLNGINIMTYDHLLAQGERLLSLFTTGSDDSEVVNVVSPVEDDDLDIGF